MSELRSKMKTEMELRGFSKNSISRYAYVVSEFSKFYKKSPDLLGEKEIREYLHYCITKKKLCEGTINFYNACLKFFYTKVLHRQWNAENLPRAKRRKKLPVVLSPEEVNAIFDATKNIKHKAIFMTIYAAGLRISEVCNLKITDIDSKNMQIVVRQGKGNKDRYTMLSTENLKILRDYWKIYKPKEYLFLGRSGTNAINIRGVQITLEKSIRRSGITPCAEHVIEYLGRYTHRVAISNNRIEAFENGYIVFKWKDYRDNNKEKHMTVTAEEFIRRFLMHVLPSKFVKIRHYGILSNRNRMTKLKKCKIFFKMTISKVTAKLTTAELLFKLTGVDINKCPCCKEKMLTKSKLDPKRPDPPEKIPIII